MANLKEIRKRIVSVQNTQKITRAMTMILKKWFCLYNKKQQNI